MGDFEKLSKEFMKNGKANSFNDLVGSAEGKKIGKMIDGEKLKKAAMSGDKETVSEIVGKVMATEEGQKLFKMINERFGK